MLSKTNPEGLIGHEMYNVLPDTPVVKEGNVTILIGLALPGTPALSAACKTRLLAAWLILTVPLQLPCVKLLDEAGITGIRFVEVKETVPLKFV